MKKVMIITLFLVGVYGMAFARITPQEPQDSIMILFGKNTKIIIASQDKEELKKLKDYDFNALLNQIVTAMENDSRADTSFVVDGDTVVMKNGQVVIKAKDKKSVTFSVKIGGKDKGAEIKVSEDGDTTVVAKKEKKHKRTEKEFTIDLGLNNYLENGRFPDESNQQYGLRPWGSRYIALGYQLRTQIGGRKSPLLIHYGLEASFNNFMFDSDQRIIKDRNLGRVGFAEVPDVSDLKKSKLTVIYANLPVMMMLDFGKTGSTRFRIGAGGYVGYRVHSYSKIMYFNEGDKEKDHDTDSFYLSNFRYGVQGLVGFRGINLFVKYDLNPLFAPGRGPSTNDLHALSFGIRL